MKKIIALLLTVVMLLGCTACSSVVSDLQDGVNDVLQNAADAANKKITRGTIDGNVYTNEFAGLTFTKPDGWAYYTDEQIADVMNVAADVIDADSFAETIGQMATVYDMMVSDPETGTNINVMYENLQLTNGGSMTAEAYADALKQQFTAVSELTYTVSETAETVKLGGEDYLRLTASVDYGGITMTQAYYLRSADTVMTAVIVTLVDDTELADIEAMFS